MAVQISDRTPRRRILELYLDGAFYGAHAYGLGMRSPLVPVCSLTRGPDGVSPLDMTTASARLADHGVRGRARPRLARLHDACPGGQPVEPLTG